MSVILLDFESRSRADLRNVGGRRYWEHPSSEVLCCVLSDPATGDRALWLPGDPCPVSPGDMLAAHNAVGFDRFAAARVWGDDYADPERWIDTSELARKAGLPGALDALGTRWLGIPKDAAASRFTKGLSSVRRPTKRTAARAPGGVAIDAITWRAYTDAQKRARGVQPEITPEALARVYAYCDSDVRILDHGWPLLESWQSVDADVSRVDRVINDRGVGFDSELARVLLAADARLSDRVCSEVSHLIGETLDQVRAIASSPARFCDWTGAPNAQAETVAAILTNPQSAPEAIALAEARQSLASIARGKLHAGLARVSSDGRLRDMHRYYGAHTGRWSGVGMQLQNMPRPSDRFEDWGDAEIDAAIRELQRTGDADRDTIDLLLRATICASPGHTLAVCDFSGVEARMLAWCAGDTQALEIFRAGTIDPYKAMASTIFGVPYETIGKDEKRAVGKIAELACGYGMGGKRRPNGGPSKFELTARSAGVDLAAVGVDAQAVVDAWRTKHAPIVRFWRALQDAFAACVAHGRETSVDIFDFRVSDDGRDVAIFLPTGRPIVYNEARISPGEYGPSISYLGMRGREHLYGGKIAENVIQAVCRELFAIAIVRAEHDGLRPVLHVHDEAVCEVAADAAKDGLAHLTHIMLDLPDWAKARRDRGAFPVGVSGHVGRRYRK